MRLLLFAAICTVAAAAAAEPVRPLGMPKAPANCPKTTLYQALEPGQPPKLRKLNELPPASTFAAVVRHVRGCEVPLVLTRGRRSK